MKRRYGLLGLLSLIGVLGLVSGNRVYLPFLAWAVFFRYLFVEADEMFTANLGRAAAWAFYLQPPVGDSRRRPPCCGGSAWASDWR